MARVSKAKTAAKPTSSKEKAISKCVEEVGIQDEVLEIYGPTQVADSMVWEVWVEDADDELATRFVEELPDGSTQVFDTFQQLAVKLNVQHTKTLNVVANNEWKKTRDLTELQMKNAAEAAKIANARIEHLVKLGMAAGGFLVSLGLAVFLAMNSNQLGAWPAAFVVLCVVASGAYYVYGKFVMPKIPAMP